MSAPFDDGGPIAASLHNGEVSVTPTGGLSMRDWFAGQALAGASANSECVSSAAGLAKWAYAMADAMLLARKPKEAP